METQEELPIKGRYYSFPIVIGNEYIQGKQFPIEHKHDGVALLGKAREVAAFGGWHPSQIYEVVGFVNWPEGELYFPSNQLELYVLKGLLIMQ